MRFYKNTLLLFVLLLITACATYKPQYDANYVQENFPYDKTIKHSFYLIGDGGNSPLGEQTGTLKMLEADLKTASKHSTLLFLGDNIYPHGMPKKDEKQRAFAEHQLKAQTQLAKDFKGRTIFIPGNHDWYSDGLKGLKRQEKFIEDLIGKNTFLPEDGCPLKRIKIGSDIVLLIVDSSWYLTNWDKHPTMNDDCEIQTRGAFFDKFESEIKKARGKTTIVAIHHPMFTNGPHGGQYDFKSHMTPLPGLGTLKNVIRKTSGISPEDLQNKRYTEFRKRIVTLSQENDKVIFVSGHEHNLQYIIKDNIPQIISGSGSKINPTRNINGGKFSSGESGYARLDVFENGSSHVRFYSATENKVVFESSVLAEDKKYDTSKFDAIFPNEEIASIYTKEETTKSDFYTKVWGKRYRQDYSVNVTAPTVNLDTLFGGLKPIRKGGGHQSLSLRLEDKNGKEYVLRAMRKSAVQYIQAVGFKDQYVKTDFEDTATEDLLLDFFAGSHPYSSFVVPTLSKAVDIYHTNPVLYYVPKQKALGNFNNEFGDELYMIEERPGDGHGDNSSFGFSNKIISTDDMLYDLHKNENHSIDEEMYIRARLFDMVIGDWDRHQDQWRWAIFKENGKTIYRPVPRDRDQAFSIMSDGFLPNILTKLIPGLRLLEAYDEELKSPKWFNLEPYPLDKALITKSDKSVWDVQIQQIVDVLNDDVINKAFTNLPKEVNQQSVKEIKRKLKGRLNNLQEISDAYYAYLNKYVVIIGTDKDDVFEVTRLANGNTKVEAFRIKKGKKGDIFHSRTYNTRDTKEIWIYGLDDDDVFKVSGNGDKLIKVRIIGGQNKDTYDIENGKSIVLYDYKSKENKFLNDNGKKSLTDDYGINVYDYKKLKNDSNELIPTIGINPDDGFKIGFLDKYTTYKFEQNPFTTQHTFSGAYYFSTNGFELKYGGEFANIFQNWNFKIESVFTSPNYSINFFGYGNSTPNNEADDNDGIDVDKDYNRVKLSTFSLSPSLVWRGQLDAQFKFGLRYESIEVEEIEDRYINTFYVENNEESHNHFFGVETSYEFENRDYKAFPTLGMGFSLTAGYRSNLKESKGFGYIIPSLSFNYKIDSEGQLVFATKFKGHLNIGDDFEFYQAASIGGDDGLRGYRNQRFTGKSSFYQSTDIRLNLHETKTSIVPLIIGIYGGFDYGRVWIDNSLVTELDYNTNGMNTSIGGGVFFNALDVLSCNLATFNSDDGLRLTFAFGFEF
ncbi:metallophosphoesterase [Yeosuana sp. MJ-SS3]|uniref:Metallophosphoesterase n=1 Tax=Gilvirhabdus luticola TaxID=3079858 RepID=A0ABU3U483_9FLAO|nr:metallophosphoesterase [Yeosuana sp. MJ-SS3]MDU8885132.1 metallophosphoesterase [Yeosuana sp. MJ-SS3]